MSMSPAEGRLTIEPLQCSITVVKSLLRWVSTWYLHSFIVVLALIDREEGCGVSFGWWVVVQRYRPGRHYVIHEWIHFSLDCYVRRLSFWRVRLRYNDRNGGSSFAPSNKNYHHFFHFHHTMDPFFEFSVAIRSPTHSVVPECCQWVVWFCGDSPPIAHNCVPSIVGLS